MCAQIIFAKKGAWVTPVPSPTVQVLIPRKMLRASGSAPTQGTPARDEPRTLKTQMEQLKACEIPILTAGFPGTTELAFFPQMPSMELARGGARAYARVPGGTSDKGRHYSLLTQFRHARHTARWAGSRRGVRPPSNPWN